MCLLPILNHLCSTGNLSLERTWQRVHLARRDASCLLVGLLKLLNVGDDLGKELVGKKVSKLLIYKPMAATFLQIPRAAMSSRVVMTRARPIPLC